MKKLLIALVIFAAILAAFLFRVSIREWARKLTAPELPPEVSYQEISRQTNPEDSPAASANSADSTNFTNSTNSINSIRPIRSTSSINLAVPFTPQAPHAVWDALHNDACEEASAMMIDAFFDGRAFDADSAEAELRDIVIWEMERFGYFEDTTAEETAVILREFYGYKNVEVREIADIEEVREVLREGRPVILPAAGRLLGNPYFRGAGPDYHMLVARGLTKDGKFITNDPGTRRGNGFVYSAPVLWNAIHDWPGSDANIERGRKVMIVVRQ